jgi:hypothetical protein
MVGERLRGRPADDQDVGKDGRRLGLGAGCLWRRRNRAEAEGGDGDESGGGHGGLSGLRGLYYGDNVPPAGVVPGRAWYD